MTKALQLLLAIAALALAGCDDARVDASADAGASDAAAFPAKCHACHGSAESPAPPRAVGGQTDTSYRGVGAHKSHLQGTASSNPIACESCHVVPAEWWDEKHIDSPDRRATVQFSGVALFKGASNASYDPDNLSCATVYCHGATLKAPGKDSKPTWTLANGSQRKCDSCHGAPPAAPHPQTGDCIGCHAATAGPNQTIADKSKHINGVVDVVFAKSVQCNGCHGAPPPFAVKKHPQLGQCELCHADTAGPNQTIANASNHMNGKVEVKLVAGDSCTSCHAAPPPPSVKNHPQDKNCQGCHADSADIGMTILSGGKHNNGKVDVVLAAIGAPCGSCHGAPPPSGVKNHPQLQNCDGCHAATAGPNQTIANAANHMNGKVEVQLPPKGAPCAGCHGAPPPKSVKNHPQQAECQLCHASTAGPDQTIATPANHLNGKVDVDMMPIYACDKCHAAPPPKSVKNHPQSLQCEGCHADTAGPGMTIAKAANHMNGKVEVALSATAQCGACHGAPPPPTVKNHPQSDKCDGCHAATAGPDQTIANPANHMNGKVELAISGSAVCNVCHGAPPTKPGHPKQDTCYKCHAVTIGADGKLLTGGGHLNGKVDFALGPASCDDCHGAPPNQPTHPKSSQCSLCHAATVDAANKIVPKGGHVNGQVDVKLPTECNACHGSANSPAPPPDVNGKSDPTLPTVGAHLAHLQGKKFSNGGMACEACHVLPKSVDDPGHIVGTLGSVTFPKGLGSWKGTAPAYDKATATCSNVYCHGALLEGGAKNKPVWNVPDIVCGSCHGLPPAPSSGHPVVDIGTLGTKACNKCHSLTILPDGTIDHKGGWHINGMVNP